MFTLLAGMNAFAELKFDKNVPADIKQQIIEDLEFMSSIQGAAQTPMHAQVFQALDGAKYKAFFDKRITHVGMSSCGGGAAVACVIPMFAPNTMWLTQNFVKFSHPQIARSMVVYHEARHTERENGNWGHDTCPTPFVDSSGKEITSIWTGAPLAGEAACDSTPYGSYGSSTIMLKNISMHCSNCSDKVKMDADMYATDQLIRIHDASVKKAMLDDFKSKHALQ